MRTELLLNAGFSKNYISSVRLFFSGRRQKFMLLRYISKLLKIQSRNSITRNIIISVFQLRSYSNNPILAILLPSREQKEKEEKLKNCVRTFTVWNIYNVTIKTLDKRTHNRMLWDLRKYSKILNSKNGPNQSRMIPKDFILSQRIYEIPKNFEIIFTFPNQ